MPVDDIAANSLLQTKDRTACLPVEWRLRVGTRLTGFVVRPDEIFPGMWRIHAPDGRVSDMVNLTRAKDAARSWAFPRGIGGTEVVHWDYREKG